MEEKIYLGISLGFNSSVAVISNQRGLLSAISQERLNGEKNTKKLPIEAMIECLNVADVKHIDQITISHYEEITDSYFKRYCSANYQHYFRKLPWSESIIKILEDKEFSIKNKEIIRVEHHTAHALSGYAFYGIPAEDDYTITSDGFGDGVSARIIKNSKTVAQIPLAGSIALVYQFVTGALGFKMHQHEGKITGLAAYGKPIYLDRFENLFDKVYGESLYFKDKDYVLDAFETEQLANSAIIDFDKFLLMKKAIFKLVENILKEGGTREDIAATVQEFSEKWILKWINFNCNKSNANCYLAGGLFANVKINQRVKETGLFKNVFVCPAMGDEGTAIGAAVSICENFNFKKKILPTIFAGNNVKGDVLEYIKTYLHDHCIENNYNVTIFNDNNVESIIAQKLSEDKIVCIVKGRMEFGPRALCHRTIMYNCDKKETNDWLNKKLSRTEFMPFAPVCNEEFADDLYYMLDGGRDSAKLMTMTFDCTEEFKNNYPAACHIDGTARPQIVSRNEDEFTWNILNEYYKLTNKKALINTSFNLHNWPIIATKEIALDSWLKSDTDCLLIENVFIEKIGGRNN